MQTTTNIGLKTYEAGDPTDWLGEFNYNMNKIDEAVGDQNDAIDVIEATAGTAVTTANTASATATEALNTAEGKTSINDNVASASTTYSSNKINELISGGAVIDDSVTSTTKTWSSSKINNEITALKQKDYEFIENPDTNKFNSFRCWTIGRGNVLYIAGTFKYNQAPANDFDIILRLPENIKFVDGGSGYANLSSGYIRKNDSIITDVIFIAESNIIAVQFSNNFDYSQIDNTYTFHFSFTLMSDN